MGFDSSSDKEPPTIVFDWLGEAVNIEPDASCVSDAFKGELEEASPLDEFEQWITERVEAQPETAAAEIVEMVRLKSRPAAIWRRVLVVAARLPQSFNAVLQPLTWAPDVLACLDLSSLIGDFLKSSFALFPEESRRRTEEAILSLPEVLASAADDPEAARGRGERARDRLLGCLPEDSLTTDAARARLSDLRSQNAVPENVPPVGSFESSFESWTETDRLESHGVDTSSPANQRINDARQPVTAFAGDWANRSPTAAASAAVESRLRELLAVLESADQGGAAPELVDLGWGDATRAAETIVRTDGLALDSSALQLARSILLAAVHHRLPEPTSDSSQFDRARGWGVPAPRLEAADGLLRLACLEEPPSADVLQALEPLAADGAPEVRFCLARGFPLLRRCAADVMWRIVDHLVREDVSTAVLSAVAISLSRVISPEAENRIQDGLETLFERGKSDRPGAEELRRASVEVSAGMYIWRGTRKAGQFVRDDVIAALESDPQAAEAIVRVLRQPLIHGDDPSLPEDAAVRCRAIELAKLTLEAANTAFSHQMEQLRGIEQPPDGHPLILNAVATGHLIEGISWEIYFASGARDRDRQSASDVSEAVRQRFYWEAAELFDVLGGVPIAAVTHHVLEALEVCIPFDPRGVFLRIRAAVMAGRGGAYELDSMGAQLVVKLVERYLAEHRTLLQEDEVCRAALVEVLDIFVGVGWPAARQLTYGLHEIYR
ncbi:hypothetical protein [Mycobacterium sp. MUNTM1]